MNRKVINICFGYSWDGDGLNKNSYKAFTKVCDSVIKQITNSKKFNNNDYSVTRRRLRGSSGGFMFDRIYKMILNANILVFDISKINANVMLELGIAIAIQRELKTNLNIFLITDIDAKENTVSDLSGYFISRYKVDKSRNIIFKDNNSFRSSMISAISTILVESDIIKNNKSYIDLDNITIM